MPACCPNCEDWINADNDLAQCEDCGLEGCEDCLDGDRSGLCWMCVDEETEED